MRKKRDSEVMNNPIRRITDNQKNVNVVAITALGLSVIALIMVIGLVGGRSANR